MPRKTTGKAGRIGQSRDPLVIKVKRELKCRQRMCEDAYRASSNGSERSIQYHLAD